MFRHESKSPRSTHSSQFGVEDKSQAHDDVAPAAPVPPGSDMLQPFAVSPTRTEEKKQSLITQEPPIDFKVYKSKFPTNLWTTNDELLRLHYINKLEKSQLTDWPYKWNFLLDEYKTLSDEMLAQNKSKKMIQQEINGFRKICPPEAEAVPKEQDLGPVPKTSSGMIGWKASKKGYIQNKYPSYLWEKHCTVPFEKQMKWPRNSRY